MTPALSASTPLADLNGGQGVAAGSIAISDGHSTSVVDLRSAQTLGDVATLIEQNPPAGRTVNAEVTSTGLTISLQPDAAYPTGDNLSIPKSAATARRRTWASSISAGAGAGPIVGQSLCTAVTANTSAGRPVRHTAAAYIHFGQPNSDIILQANTAGAATRRARC